MYIGTHVKYPLFLFDLMKLELPQHFFSKNILMSNFMKIRLVGTYFHKEIQMDGETDRHDEANSRLSQFCERP